LLLSDSGIILSGAFVIPFSPGKKTGASDVKITQWSSACTPGLVVPLPSYVIIGLRKLNEQNAFRDGRRTGSLQAKAMSFLPLDYHEPSDFLHEGNPMWTCTLRDYGASFTSTASRLRPEDFENLKWFGH
jgi:hypothetical protein